MPTDGYLLPCLASAAGTLGQHKRKTRNLIRRSRSPQTRRNSLPRAGTTYAQFSTVPAPASHRAPAAKPPDKPKKVITNDDLKGSWQRRFGVSPMEFGEVNDCDRNCFEKVRQMARVPTSVKPELETGSLQAIDQVRKDDEWQKYLRELYDVHLKFCQFGE